MVRELREVQRQQAALIAETVRAGFAEPVPALHPNLPELYRRRVEALRSLIDAILVLPGEHRGEVTVQLRGDLAAFLHLEPADGTMAPDTKKPALRVQSGRSNIGLEVLEWWEMRGQDLNL